jgi:hypothetical protein
LWSQKLWIIVCDTREYTCDDCWWKGRHLQGKSNHLSWMLSAELTHLDIVETHYAWMLDEGSITTVHLRTFLCYVGSDWKPT